jgi:hypothetical protein
MSVPNYVPLAQAQEVLRSVAAEPLFTGRDPFLRVVGVKMYLDGGMLTGSSYMLKPWGTSPIYGITDPQYRGVLYVQPEKLQAIVRTATELQIPFTAHSVGDGAVHTLLDAYAAVDGAGLNLRALRPCITHCNFQSPEAVAQAAKLGVMMDIQPVWLFSDGRTLAAHFGEERMRWFQPLKSLFDAGVIVGGGSDHMLKIGASRAINLYNPFLGMATALKRVPKFRTEPLVPEQRLSREQVLRMFTANNAHLLFSEQQLGSLEPGKAADFVILDRNLLECPLDEVAATRVRRTYVDGRCVFTAQP